MIAYSCIARGETILVDCSNIEDQNYREVVASILPSFPSRGTERKTSYNAKDVLFHTILHDDVLYLVISDLESGYVTPYNFLTEVKRRFCSTSLIVRASSAGPFAFTREFQPVLHQLMMEASSGNVFADLNSQVDDVKNVMNENIEKLLQRGETLDDLLRNTQNLEIEGNAFRTKTRRVKNRFWWENVKMWIVLAFVIVTVVTLTTLFFTCVIKIGPNC
ncbi:vesicle-associated membrane protein 7-like [Symsagittifera roscoffensis]|uniref:vesicle-associated membrane protein 7-like n=1 Tax=Symsagittifera roscoffensis TaxID=84072 RepID=UPI00307C82EC